MAYKSTDNTTRIMRETDNRAGLAIRLMLEAIHRQSTPTTPMRTGNLRADIRKRVNGKNGSIHWGAKYAAYQERGYTSGPVKRYTTAGTGKNFAKKAVENVKNDSRQYFKIAGLL